MRGGLASRTETCPARLRSFYEKVCDIAHVRTAYRCRAYPDEQQQAVFSRTFGCVRVVWNRTLAARHARYAAEGKGTSYAETDHALTAMKRDPRLRFLTEVSSVPLQQTLRHQHQAFTAFYEKRARYPRFKSRRPTVRALHPVGVLPARWDTAAGQDDHATAVYLDLA